MKILQVLHNHPPEFRGGVERYVENLCAGLSTLGHEVAVCCGSDEQTETATLREEAWGGVPVFRLVRGLGVRNPADPVEPGLVPLYEQVLDRWAPDVVHVHHWWNLGDDVVRRGVARGVPVVVTLHDFFTTCSLFFRMPNIESASESVNPGAPCELEQGPETCVPCLNERMAILPSEMPRFVGRRSRSFAAELSAAAAVLTPSRSHAEYLAKWLPISVPLRPVPLGSPVLDAAPRTGTPFPDGPLRILHFGNLSRLKGVEVLVSAVRMADPDGDGIQLVLAGGRCAEDVDLEGITLVPEYDSVALAALAAAADVAVFPSLALETYGLVADEAIRLGLPVVVSDRGALGERVGGRGVMVPANDVAALADVLRGFLDDPARLTALNDAPAPEILDSDGHASTVAAIYDEVRGQVLPAVDLESPLLERLARISEILPALTASPSPSPADNLDVAAPSREPPGSTPMITQSYPIETKVAVDDSGDLVSVITRTRNRRHLLQEAVASVAAQDYPHVELVVCNDGGEDVADILDPYRERLKITYVDPGGVGRCKAGNVALEHASGTWIAWLDDDDLHYPNHLSTLVAKVKATGARLAYTDAHRIDVTVRADGTWEETGRSVPYSQDFSRLMLFRQAYIHLVTVLHHRECMERLGGFDESLEVLEDWDMFFRFAQDYEFVHEPAVTSAFRIRDDDSNAVTALRKEFADTRTRLFQRYIHVAFPELLGMLDAGRGQIEVLELRVQELEAKLAQHAAGDVGENS